MLYSWNVETTSSQIARTFRVFL